MLINYKRSQNVAFLALFNVFKTIGSKIFEIWNPWVLFHEKIGGIIFIFVGKY